MPRGRPRKASRQLPAHIDPAKIPVGLYWDGSGMGRWRLAVKDGGKLRWRTVAHADAQLSDLHRIAEDATARADTLHSLAEAFANSAKFRALAKATRDDYRYCQRVVLDHPTRIGKPFGALELRRINRPLIQRLVDQLAAGTERDTTGTPIPTPSKAAHCQRYLRRLFEWGINRGYLTGNPADGIELPAERKARVMPTHDAMHALTAYAKQHAGHRGQAGSVAAYLWAVIEIAYLCRLRGIEVLDLTEADVLDTGLRCRRRKGSRENIVTWTPRLRAAVLGLLEIRKDTWARRKQPTPIALDQRPLVVSITGGRLTRSALHSAWQRLIASAIADEVMTSEQRFNLHGLKRRGITDTDGTRGEKQLASGHRTEAMLDVYDQSVPVVAPAGLRKNRESPQ